MVSIVFLLDKHLEFHLANIKVVSKFTDSTGTIETKNERTFLNE